MSAKPSNKLRVLLVDDSELVRVGLRSVIEGTDDIEVVAEAASVATAVTTAAQCQPDVVLLDLRLKLRGQIARVCQQPVEVRPVLDRHLIVFHLTEEVVDLPSQRDRRQVRVVLRCPEGVVRAVVDQVTQA